MGNYVLIVDDDPDDVGLVMDVLGTFDVEGREASNGEVALEIITQELPRAIVLDLMMPVMDGYNFIEKLQGITGAKDIPIIVLSALADHHTHISLKRLPGVVAVVSKGDFSMQKLQSVVTLALEKS